MDIIGIASPCVDLLVNVDEFPEPNSGARMQEYSWQGGGKVATALVAAARLGAQVGAIAIVGDGPFGSFCRQDFARHGIDVSEVLVDTEGESAFSVPLSENKTGIRNIIYHPGTHRAVTLDDVDETYLASARYLHLAWASPTARAAAELARAHGVRVGFDAERYHPGLEEVIPLIDVFIGSERCYRDMFGEGSFEENCRAVQARGPHIAGFTLGERGAVGVAGASYFEQPGFSVPVRDTTGAGDVYHGAFLYGLCQDWPISRVARFSSAVAAIKCTRLGGRAAIPTREVVDRFLETGEIDYREIDQRVAFYRTLQA